MRWILILLGVIMVLLGGLWALQGINVLIGSPMSGQPFWVIVGTLVLIVGAVLCYLGLRRGAARPTL